MAKLLITGGTGSFGSATVKRFLDDKRFSEIIIFSRDEDKQYSMHHRFNNKKLTFFVGDVRDRDSILRASRGVDFIFHAAALKHVPTGEVFPIEFVRTNIIGTDNVLFAAEENKVKKVVFLSTDKSVFPINAMGMTKAIAEKLISAKANESKIKKLGTTFCAVRYGNVMASRGSVIPIFVEAAKSNKPIVVTDPKMTRFLLSIEDAVDLVLLAIDKGGQGDVFIKKAPSSTVGDLAQAIKNIFKSKSKIEVAGVRAGEKVHESLAHQFELSRAEDLGGFYRIRDGLSYVQKEFAGKSVAKEIKSDYTSLNTDILTVPEIEKLLKSIDYIKNELKKAKK